MSKGIRKLLSLILAAAVCFNIVSEITLSDTASAAVPAKGVLYISRYTADGTDEGYQVFGYTVDGVYSEGFLKLNVGGKNGQAAYCIEPNAPVTNDHSTNTSNYGYTGQNASDYLNETFDDTTKLYLKYAMMYGYKGASRYSGYSEDVQRIATQIVIWCIVKDKFNNSSEAAFIESLTSEMDTATSYNYGVTKAKVKACCAEIKGFILAHQSKPSYNGKKYKLSYDRSTGTYKTTITDSNAILECFDWQTAIDNAGYGKYISATVSGNKIVITSTIPIAQSANITLTAKKTKGKYNGKYQYNIMENAVPVYLVGDSFFQDGITYSGASDSDPVKATISLYTDSVGSLRVTKKWDSADTLTNAEIIELNKKISFTVKNSNGKYVMSKSTSSAGVYNYSGVSSTAQKYKLNESSKALRIDNLPAGTYIITEICTIDNYEPTQTTQVFNVKAGVTSPASTTTTFTNEQKTATAHIAKSWVSADELTAEQVAAFEKQVYFTVKDSDGKYLKVNDGKADNDGWYVYDGTQDTEGKFYLKNSSFRIKSLPLGTYTVTEYNSTGFSPAQQTKTLTLSKDGETKKAAFINKSSPVLVIRKQFSDEDKLSADELARELGKVTVNLKIIGFAGQTTPSAPSGYYLTFTGNNGAYTCSGTSQNRTAEAI